MIKIYIQLMLIFSVQLFSLSAHAEQSFFKHSNQYRGFYWFEQEEKVKKKQELEQEKKQKEVPTFASLSPDAAMKNMEARKIKLAEGRAVMMELSFQGASKEEMYKAVRNYKKLENEMRNSGMALAGAWEMVNFTNPEFIDRINNPVNVPANKIKRADESKQRALKIRDFASKYDLVLFEKTSCPYCQAFKPIIGHFVSTHSFKLDVVGNNPEHMQLIEMLKIEAAPTLVAVRKDGKDAFELARSLLTLSELEQQVIFATELLENKQQVASNARRVNR